MATVDEIREAIEEKPGNVRLFLVLKSGEHLHCSSRRVLAADTVTVWVRGEKRTVGLDQVANVGVTLVTRRAALAAA